ncbi:hypothetical protein BsWGS_17458 [Bradybaena similaris]
MEKIIKFKADMFKGVVEKLTATIRSYELQITGSTQAWIEKSQPCDQESFVKLSLLLDEAMMLVMQKVAEIESSFLKADICSAQTHPETMPCPAAVISKCEDRPSCSLQDRVHALEKVVGIVQSDLEKFRKQIDYVEGMKANLENLASQLEVVTKDTSLQQIQREIDNYKNQHVTSMRNFEEKLLKIEKSLSLTDCNGKQATALSAFLREEHRALCDSSSKFDDRLCDLEKKYERVMMMEDKLTDLEETNRVLKLQTDRVVRGRRQESNDVAVVLEKFSDLKIEISNMTNRKLHSFDDRLQSLENNKNAQTEIRSMGFQETRPTSTFAGTVTTQNNSYSSYIARGYNALPGIPWQVFSRGSRRS